MVLAWFGELECFHLAVHTVLLWDCPQEVSLLSGHQQPRSPAITKHPTTPPSPPDHSQGAVGFVPRRISAHYPVLLPARPVTSLHPRHVSSQPLLLQSAAMGSPPTAVGGPQDQASTSAKSTLFPQNLGCCQHF